MKIIIAVGTRPNIIKLYPLIKEFKRYRKIKTLIVHTGQHYDYVVSDIFLKDFKFLKWDYYLEANCKTSLQQIAKIMLLFERICVTEKPNLIIVIGDVNSTLACSIVAKKLNVKLAHIESGLRNFDMSMPEEINRILVDRLSDYLFVTEKSAITNLKQEGYDKNKIFFVGNILIDSLIYALKKVNKINFHSSVSILKNKLKKYGMVTLHRQGNVDNPIVLTRIINILNDISNKLPLIFPVHPHTDKNIKKNKIKFSNNIYYMRPFSYLEFIFFLKDARFVLTDSGGVQEESTFLKIPCLTLRENTERPITVSEGTNMIVGIDETKIKQKIDEVLCGKYKHGKIPKFWDGRAAKRIVKIIISTLN